MKLFMHKKGVSEDAGFWIFRIILIVIVVFSIVFFVNSIITKNIETENLELYLINARIINSPFCLAYQDDNGRVHPGEIAMYKYNEYYLQRNCIIKGKEEFVGVMIKLEDENPIYINKEYYEDIEPLTFSKKYAKVKKNIPVLVDGKIKAIEITAVARQR